MGKRKKAEEVKFSKKLRKIIKLYSQLNEGVESVDLTEAQIDEINRRSLPRNRITRKLYKKPARGITTATFIIPVEEGVVTGYLYRNEDQKKQLSNLSPLIVF